MKRACVIGWPITHSRSPMIHSYWLEKYKIAGTYTKQAVAPDDLGAFLDALPTSGLAGCNVTVPHKEAVFARAGVKESSAAAVGAANTLWLEEGRICAANTDTYGFMTNLTQSAPDWQNRSGAIVILGAGGSARAVIHGFLEAGAPDVRVINRSVARAEDVARTFGPRVTAHAWHTRDHHARDASVIVNTTTLGMNGAGTPDIDFSGVATGAVAADLVYVPMQTEFLKAAKARGLTTVGGLGMLLHQAVPGFEKWFGVRPEVTPELYQLVAKSIEAA